MTYGARPQETEPGSYTYDLAAMMLWMHGPTFARSKLTQLILEGDVAEHAFDEGMKTALRAQLAAYPAEGELPETQVTDTPAPRMTCCTMRKARSLGPCRSCPAKDTFS